MRDTPSFPRELRGPRGGRFRAPTPCAECVSFASCRPGPCSAPFGCESWVDLDGRRVEPEPRIDYDDPDAEPCEDCATCPELDTCGQDYDDPRPGELDAEATMEKLANAIAKGEAFNPRPLFQR